MIGRCIANRPYMYLPLKGDTNDYSVNAQNPSNTGVTSTTGEFGESNGAYEWADNTDKLEWSSSIGNTIATNLNSNATIILNSTISRFLGTTGTSQLMLGQYIGAGSSNSSFYCGYNKDQSLVSTKRSSTAASTIIALTPVLTTSTWYNMAFTYSSNNLKMFLDGSEIKDDNFTEIANVSSTEVFKIGNHFPGTNNWLGKMYNFRIYDVTLSNGALSILNNEKGRISLPKKLLLDTYSGASAAYSVRKLRYNYNGSAIRVRRASDDAEQDIGFIANQLDIASLESFCSGTDGFVTTWYDQTTNGYNLTNTTAAEQPQIVSSGTTLTQNGKPCLRHDGTNDVLSTSLITKPSRFSVYSVLKADATATTYNAIGSSNSGAAASGWGSLRFNTSNKNSTYWGDGTNFRIYETSSTSQDTNQNIYSVLYDSSTNIYMYKNNLNLTLSLVSGSATTSGGTSYPFASGGIGLGGFYLDGDIQEVIVYSTYEGTNNSGINGNINSYFGVY